MLINTFYENLKFFFYTEILPTDQSLLDNFFTKELNFFENFTSFFVLFLFYFTLKEQQFEPSISIIVLGSIIFGFYLYNELKNKTPVGNLCCSVLCNKRCTESSPELALGLTFTKVFYIQLSSDPFDICFAFIDETKNTFFFVEGEKFWMLNLDQIHSKFHPIKINLETFFQEYYEFKNIGSYQNNVGTFASDFKVFNQECGLFSNRMCLECKIRQGHIMLNESPLSCFDYIRFFFDGFRYD